MKIVTTPEELAAAFTRWEKARRERPDYFKSPEESAQQTPEESGDASALYFVELLVKGTL